MSGGVRILIAASLLLASNSIVAVGVNGRIRELRVGQSEDDVDEGTLGVLDNAAIPYRVLAEGEAVTVEVEARAPADAVSDATEPATDDAAATAETDAAAAAEVAAAAEREQAKAEQAKADADAETARAAAAAARVAAKPKRGANKIVPAAA